MGRYIGKAQYRAPSLTAVLSMSQPSPRKSPVYTLIPGAAIISSAADQVTLVALNVSVIVVEAWNGRES